MVLKPKRHCTTASWDSTKKALSMIVFDLRCNNGHTFEGWFEDSAAFDSQQAGGLLACPVCGSTAVAKALSAVAIRTSSRNLPASQGEDHGKMIQLLNKIADYVETHFDNVGSDFAKEALKIHYGVAQPRSIRGVSSTAEEKMLTDEGVPFLKLPLPVRPDPDPGSSQTND